VRFGSFRRLTPVSRQFGWDRGGLPVDRYYIEAFLERHAADIAGRVLEARDDAYTRKYGGARVTRADVLHPTADNPKATIVTDLTCADDIPGNASTASCSPRLLHPGRPGRGPTIHGFFGRAVSRSSHPGHQPDHPIRWERWGDYWRFTTVGTPAVRVAFPSGDVRSRHTERLVATAPRALDRDLAGPSRAPRPDYEVLYRPRREAC
jgi:hypothetical protein